MKKMLLRTASSVGALGIITRLSMAGSAAAAVGVPTVALTSTSLASSASAASIPITVRFSQSVTGFGSSNIRTTNGSVSSFSGSGSIYTFNLVPATRGTTTAQVPVDVVFVNSNASSTTATSTTTMGNQASNLLTFFSTIASTSTASTSTQSTSSTPLAVT